MIYIYGVMYTYPLSLMQQKLFWFIYQYLSAREAVFRQKEECSKLIVHFCLGKNTSRLVKGCTVAQCLTLISGHPVRNLSPLWDTPALCQRWWNPPTTCSSNVPEHAHYSQLLEPQTSSFVRFHLNKGASFTSMKCFMLIRTFMTLKTE